MSSDKSLCISKAPPVATLAPPGDHRKRRRNRTTQSCLNCHASKRMCDRKRPACQRCTTLGLTGLCVYEVDDPSQRSVFSDEKALLRSRVAELEGVIREMKNKPHPRWSKKSVTSQMPGSQSSDDDSPPTSKLASSGTNDSQPASDDFTLTVEPVHPDLPNVQPTLVSSSPGASSSCESLLTPQDPYFLSASNLPSPPSSSSSSSSTLVHRALPQVILSDASPTHDADFNVDNLLAVASFEPTGFEDGIYGQMLDHIMRADQAKSSGLHGCDAAAFVRSRDTCGCITNVMAYNNLLELSVRLRKAVESLGRVAAHRPGETDSACQLYSKICELDKLTSTALGNVMSPADRLPALDTFLSPPSSEFVTSTISPQSLTDISQWESNVIRPVAGRACNSDSFMSWDGARRESWPYASVL